MSTCKIRLKNTRNDTQGTKGKTGSTTVDTIRTNTVHTAPVRPSIAKNTRRGPIQNTIHSTILNTSRWTSTASIVNSTIYNLT